MRFWNFLNMQPLFGRDPGLDGFAILTALEATQLSNVTKPLNF